MYSARTARLVIAGTIAGLLPVIAARADTNSAFSNIAGDISVNLTASFNPFNDSIGQLAIDPNNPAILYGINRNVGPDNATPKQGGVYAYDLTPGANYGKRRTTPSGGAIFFTSAAPMTWTSTAEPYSAVVANDGSLYLAFNVSAGVYKITNPLSDTPTVTKIMAGYGGAGDDDPAGIARMPASFGAAGYTSSDFVLFDDGLNIDNNNAVAVVHPPDGTTSLSSAVVVQRPSTTAGTIHGGVDPVSGYAYYLSTQPERNTIGGNTYATLFRVKGDGILQTINLRIPAGVAFTNADDPIAVNPVDGSVWIVDSVFSGTTDTGARNVMRVDPRYLTPTSDANQFIADASTEFSATAFNIGVNSMTFTSDGKTLLVGTPSGTDRIWAFNTIVHNPGDANGDGTLTADDYALLDRGFANSLTGWTNGDFNNDGSINSADYLILDSAYAAVHPAAAADLIVAREAQFGADYASSLLASVPEPTSLAACGVVLLPLARRRRT